MSIGAAVGITCFWFYYFFKIKGIMSGAPITFTGQHILNLILGIGIFVLIFSYVKLNQLMFFGL